MKRIYTLAAILMAALMAKAETEFTAFQNEDISEINISDYNTDRAYLENKRAIMAAPKEGQDKDAKYWSQAVLSRIKVLGYAQAGYTATFNANGNDQNTFDMKRAVIMAAAEISPKFFAFFMHEFKSGAMQEYYMEYRPCKGINVRFGQSKNEITMANPMSPRVLESINCSPLSVAWLCGADPLMSNGSGRDMGITLYGDLFKDKVRYYAQVVNGGQINKADNNTQKNIIAKIEYKPMKNLRLSASGQLGRNTAVATSAFNPDIKVGQRYRSDRLAGGFEWLSSVKGNDWWKHRCASIRAEVIGGRDGNCHSFGAYAATTVPVYKQLDVVGQVDYFNRNTDLGCKQTDITAGVQYWIHTKLRLQAQYTQSLLSHEMQRRGNKTGNYGAFMAQAQFSF